MTPTPPYLANLVEYLNKDVATLPTWEASIITDLKAVLQKDIKEHFETSAITRQKFVSMTADIWQDPSNGLFSLVEKPRKVLGYLPKPYLQKLDDFVRVPLTEHVSQCREKLNQIMEQIRASQSDRAEIADTLARPDFFFADLEKHHQELEKWNPLRDSKVPIISELEQREEFLEEIEEFEAKASGDKDRYKKTNSLAIADENKFRAYAAKKLKELDSKGIKLCRQWEADTGRVFEVDGVKYLEMIKEQKFGRSANPSLSLAKLRPEAITAAEKQKYAGVSPSNLVVDQEAVHKKSLLETGDDPKIIRNRRSSTEQD